MGDKKEKQGISDQTLGWTVGTLLGIVLIHRVSKWFLIWILKPQHKVGLISGVIFCLTPLLYRLARKRENILSKRKKDAAVIGDAEGAVFCGHTDKKKPVFIKERQRGMHTQVIGTTNAGKTESVILPWAIQDIRQGRGLILVDGKADRSLLNKLWAYVVDSGREKEFRLFSLSNLEASHQFNPLIGGTPEEISERVFNAFEFENPHYRSVQFEIFSQVMRIFAAANLVPTFLRLHQVITEPNKLVFLVKDIEDEALKTWATYYRELPPNDRVQRTSGLTAAISHFAFGKTSCLFNTEEPAITLEDALQKT